MAPSTGWTPTGGLLVELKLRDLGASESMKIHV
jgi:hypothetical protein